MSSKVTSKDTQQDFQGVNSAPEYTKKSVVEQHSMSDAQDARNLQDEESASLIDGSKAKQRKPYKVLLIVSIVCSALVVSYQS